jgi:hypothetical protein
MDKVPTVSIQDVDEVSFQWVPAYITCLPYTDSGCVSVSCLINEEVCWLMVVESLQTQV